MKLYMLYWILSFNFFSIFIFLISITAGVEFYNCMIDIWLNILCLFMVLVLVLIGSYVYFISFNYLSIIEYYLFLFYIYVFLFLMYSFCLLYCIIIIFAYYKWIGLNSYLLINYWSPKTYCGIKAVVYNKYADSIFLLLLTSYWFINYLFINSIEINLWYYYIINFEFNPYYINYYNSLFLLFIYFCKSAQFPFSFWLLYAMSAPTPISSLLHSSTLVIIGVYLILIFDLLYYIFSYLYELFYYLASFNPYISLFVSLIIGFWLSDIKSLIACSTINNLSYIFISCNFDLLLVLYYILAHALFKSLIFLYVGSFIHIQLNFQSLFKIKFYNSLIKILFISAVIILIFSFSKEDIIHCSNLIYNSTFIYILILLSGIFTNIYNLKIYIYCFYNSFNDMFNYTCFILSILTFNSILIDQCLDFYFYFDSFSLFNALDFGSLFSLFSFFSIPFYNGSGSFISIFFIPLFISFLFYLYFPVLIFSPFSNLECFYVDCYNPENIIPPFLFYFTFQVIFLLFSTEFLRAPIHSISLFTGCSSSYSLYYIHYLTSFQFIYSFISSTTFLIILKAKRPCQIFSMGVVKCSKNNDKFQAS